MHFNITDRYLNINSNKYDKESEQHILFGSLFHPIAAYNYTIRKNKTEPVIKYIIRDSLKLPNNDAACAFLISNEATQFIKRIQDFEQSGVINRKETGIIIIQ
jgi:hypothetical protein